MLKKIFKKDKRSSRDGEKSLSRFSYKVFSTPLKFDVVETLFAKDITYLIEKTKNKTDFPCKSASMTDIRFIRSWRDPRQRWGEEEAWRGGAGVAHQEEGEEQADHSDWEGGAGA